MPYEVGVYDWVNTNSTGTIVIKEKRELQEPTVNIIGNHLTNIEDISESANFNACRTYCQAFKQF